MTSSERAIVACFVLIAMAGFIAGQAWPQRDVHVPHLVGEMTLLAAGTFSLTVLYLRRGRP